MKLYHGSNVKITAIDLTLSKKGKGFGQGFYLNPVFKQAKKMASKVTNIRNEGEAIVSIFEYDEEVSWLNGLINDYPLNGDGLI